VKSAASYRSAKPKIAP